MAEKSTLSFLLPSGAQIDVEAPREHRVGAADVAANSRGPIPFKAVIEPLGEFADLVFSEIQSRVRKPDSIELEFGASFKGQTRLVIVSGEAEANIKVTLTWKRTADGD